MPNSGQFAGWRQDQSSKSRTFGIKEVERVPSHRRHVRCSAQNVQPVTNGTSPPKRLLDHLFTTFWSGKGDSQGGVATPFFMSAFPLLGCLSSRCCHSSSSWSKRVSTTGFIGGSPSYRLTLALGLVVVRADASKRTPLRGNRSPGERVKWDQKLSSTYAHARQGTTVNVS